MEVNNLTKFKIDKKIFSTVAKKVLSGENSKRQISLAFVDSQEIKKLNKKFRKRDKATDVLSFSAQTKPCSVWNNEKDFLGEIVICPEVVKKNAKKYKVSVKSELLKVFVHGILHLCGYDHEKSEKEAEEMERREKFYLSKI
jgi:probable rRNA maturation factor